MGGGEGCLDRAYEQSGHLQLDKWNKFYFIKTRQRSASKIIMWTPDWGENKQQQAAQLPLLMVWDYGNDGVYSPLLCT